MNLHQVLRQRTLNVVVCVSLLGGGLLPQHAVSGESTVIGSLTLGSSFDSTLLQGYFNLDLDRQSTQKTMQSDIKSVGQPTKNISLDDLGVTFPNTFLSNFSKEEKRITFNPLPAFAFPVHLALPAISQVPVQSNTPSFLSLVMLSLGGVALLGWLRTKRQKQRIYTGSHSKV